MEKNGQSSAPPPVKKAERVEDSYGVRGNAVDAATTARHGGAMNPTGPAGDRLATRILWGMAVGIALGLGLRALGAQSEEMGRSLTWVTTQVFDPLGQVFLRLLFFVVVPLVFCSLVLGVVQLGQLRNLGRLAGQTFTLFGVNMAIGVALGLVFMNLAQPGAGVDTSTVDQLIAAQGNAVAQLGAKAQQQQEAGFNLTRVLDMFMPRNLLSAVVNCEVLPLITFALLLGAAGTTLATERRQSLERAMASGVDLMTVLVGWALRLAPYAVVLLLASAVTKFGAAFLGKLLFFALGVLGVIALHLFGTMSVLLKLFTRRSLGEFFSAVRIVLVTAFSTSSSNTTLPTAMQVTTARLGVSASTAGFVLPLGATMNMSGTALYEGCVVLFVAQVYGVDLTLLQQGTLLLLSVLSAVAVAGIPGGSLPLIMGLLASFGIPAEGIALVLGIDRILDMARTALNVGADVVTACIVDDWNRARTNSKKA